MELLRTIVLTAVVSLLACAAPPAGGKEDTKPTAATGLTLTSPTFNHGQAIPSLHTGDGEDLSPALAWAPVPESTRSFALICRDPDAPRGTFIHWVIYNIPAVSEGIAGLPGGLPQTETLPNGAIQGPNDFGRIGYNGPKPPPGKPHRYFFDLYALDITLPAEPGINAARLSAVMNDHILAKAELMGTYRR